MYEGEAGRFFVHGEKDSVRKGRGTACRVRGGLCSKKGRSERVTAGSGLFERENNLSEGGGGETALRKVLFHSFTGSSD